jgi:acetolactate synthase-1/3 small subunit
MRHIISVLVENEFGVLARVAGLFSGRGFNIESLCVAPTTDASVSRMTLVTSGDDKVLEQITKHLNKLVNVIKVSDFSAVDHVERELVLVKVTADEKTRGEVVSVANIFRGKVVDVASDSYVVEVTGTEDKIAAFINLLRPFGIKEVVRTGVVGMFRGSKVLAAASDESVPLAPEGHEGRLAREGSEADFV